MNENIKISLDRINYDSLFRISRYTLKVNQEKYHIFFIIIKSIIRLIFFKIEFLETQRNKPKIINSFERKDYSSFIDKLTFNNSIGKCHLKYRFGFGHKWIYIKEVFKQVKLKKS